MKTQPFIARQGDVMIVAVDAIPAGAEVKIDEKDRVILAYGEVTGHAHAIARTDSIQKLVKDGIEYLEASDTVEVKHEEHGTIEVPAGKYRILHQVEHSPIAGLQRVMD